MRSPFQLKMGLKESWKLSTQSGLNRFQDRFIMAALILMAASVIATPVPFGAPMRDVAGAPKPVHG